MVCFLDDYGPWKFYPSAVDSFGCCFQAGSRRFSAGHFRLNGLGRSVTRMTRKTVVVVGGGGGGGGFFGPVQFTRR